MEQFNHGGEIYKFASKLNCEVEGIIDLSSNINFLKPDCKTDFNNLKIDSYPNYDNLYNSLSDHFNIDTNQLELYNGASSAIFSFFRAIENLNCTIYSPAYLEYKKAAVKFEKNLTLINRFTELDKNVLPNSIVIFVNPSTPDGTYYELGNLLQYWEKQNCIVLIDESFLEFTNKQSCIKYLNNYKNLYILKSLTKFYSCAGVRIGAILSSKNNILQLKENEPLWKISQFDSSYIQEVLKDKQFQQISKVTTITNREYLYKILNNSSLFEFILPSEANFILARLKKLTAHELQNRLINYKIMIRDCSNFDFLDEKYVRIAIKSLKSLKSFEQAVKSIEETL